MRILTLDVGTSSVKAGYWNGKRFTHTSRAEIPGRYKADRAEIPTRQLLRSLETAARACLAGQQKPDAIAFDAFSSGVVGLDASGKSLFGIITHQDRRSTLSAQQLVQSLGEKEILRRAGNLPFPGGIASSTLHWLHTHERTRLRACTHIGQASSLIARHLTGRWVIDPSQAAFLGLMNIRTLSWDPLLCNAVGIHPRTLPHIEWADEILGMTLPAVSARLGLATGTPVIGGFVDTSAAVLNTPMQPGQLVHSSGTTDVLALCVDRPRPAPHLLTRPVGIGRHLPPRWLTVSTISSAGSAILWARREIFRDLSDAAFDTALRSACKSPPPAPLACEPWFAGDRTSLASKTAALSGLTLSTTREQLLSAIVAGLAQTSAQRYIHIAKTHPILPRVFTMGGAKTLAAALHAHWPRAHRFSEIPGDALAGLVRLAHAALQHS